MAVHQSISLSYDAIILSSALLVIGYGFSFVYGKDKITKKDIIIFIFVCVIVLLTCVDFVKTGKPIIVVIHGNVKIIFNFILSLQLSTRFLPINNGIIFNKKYTPDFWVIKTHDADIYIIMSFFVILSLP